MAIAGVSITKEVAFRDSVQPFSNVYYYNNGLGTQPTESQADDLINAIVTAEKTFHSTLVTFAFARCWHQTLTEIGTVMLKQKALTGTGSAASDSGLDKERAFLFRWRAGLDSRGAPVYLRKWYHSCGVFPGGALLGTVIANATGFTSAQRTAMAGNANALRNVTAGGQSWELCAKSGRAISGGEQAVAHQYLEHHQLGDQWRGA
jgi:hypothetical protein